VPQAAVVATNAETGVQASVRTNATGFYRLQNLPIGAYDVSVEHAGFRKYVRQGVTLTTGEQLGLDVTLELGATGQSVTITGEAPLVESRTSEVNSLIESKSIDALPLGNRRTLNVLQLSGAAVFVSYPNTPANVNPNFSIAGGRTQSQMAWIDGGNAQNMRMGAAQINLDPPVETIEEVKVLTNTYSAEYGASASGVVIETTKSGTNQLHGGGYEFFRNNAMDAPGFFAPIVNGHKVSPELQYNVFGATVGGPIRRDKTFFFVAYEGQRLHTSSTSTLTVPTLLQRNGDFSPDPQHRRQADSDLRSRDDTDREWLLHAPAFPRQRHSSEPARSSRRGCPGLLSASQPGAQQCRRREQFQRHTCEYFAGELLHDQGRSQFQQQGPSDRALHARVRHEFHQQRISR
jgi:hypothetical protein